MPSSAKVVVLYPTSPAMRRARLAEVRDAILAAPLGAVPDGVGFDMGDFGMGSECGTACCVGGHAVLTAGCRDLGVVPTWGGYRGLRVHVDGAPGDFHAIGDVAREYLGLSHREASNLFYEWGNDAASQATRDEKVTEIDALIEATPDGWVFEDTKYALRLPTRGSAS